jgi:hypothetical protein
MPSELSASIAKQMLVAKAQGRMDQEYSAALELLCPEIDTQLKEVSEVLNDLRQSQDCWCVGRWRDAHDERCDRTRALYRRLSISRAPDSPESK